MRLGLTVTLAALAVVALVATIGWLVDRNAEEKQ
jgi:uncharacterized membrane protein YqjE